MNKTARVGLVGSVIAAICCFTPLLVWAFAALGLASAIAYIDLVLLPVLALFVALAVYGFWKSRR